jgi:hypothetical protein
MMRSAAPSLYGFVVAGACLVAGFGFAAGHLRHALLVYLACWLFVLGVVVGSMTLWMIHALTGGEWGMRLGEEWFAASRLLPYAAVAAIPLLIGMHVLFPWLQNGMPVDDRHLEQQRWYLNATGLLVRTVAAFAIWAWTGYGVIRRAQPARAGAAAAGVIAMLFTVTMVAVDWVMSLVPRWHTTDIGLLLLTSQLLIAFALAVLVRLGRDVEARTAPPRLRRDFGNLMLVMVLGWG